MRRLLLLTAPFALAACAEGIDPPAGTPAVTIAGGSFSMGTEDIDPCDRFQTSGREAQLAVRVDEQSARVVHSVTVDDFCIDQHEVTVEQYRHCFARGTCGYPQVTNAGDTGPGFIARYYTEHETFGEYPALGVSHEDAIKYCTFRGGRLPTEAEWEFVATSRGARDRVWEDPSLDALLLDGCENSDQRDAVAVGACGSRVRPVMSSTADRTAQGVHDLAGNAREWTADEYDPLAYCDAQQPGGALTDVFTWTAGKPLPAATRSLLTAAASADTCIDLDPESAVGRYEGACIDDFGRCTAVCGPVFDVAPELRRQRWAKYACAARAGFNPGTVDDPAFPACDAEECGENCQQYCNCQQNPPPLPTDSGDCLQACDAVAETCMGVCTVPGLAFNCVQFETGRNCLPTPWCKPREGASGSEPHLRPSAFDAGIEGAWTVRGGHFQLGNDRPEDICQAAPSSRRGQQTADALTGFRCAYDKGTPRCP